MCGNGRRQQSRARLSFGIILPFRLIDRDRPILSFGKRLFSSPNSPRSASLRLFPDQCVASPSSHTPSTCTSGVRPKYIAVLTNGQSGACTLEHFGSALLREVASTPRRYSNAEARRTVCCASLAKQRITMPASNAHTVRRSSRVPIKVPIRVTSMEPDTQFSEICETLVVSAHGCALRFPLKLDAGSALRLHSRGGRQATAYVVFCQPIGPDRPDRLPPGCAARPAGQLLGIGIVSR